MCPHVWGESTRFKHLLVRWKIENGTLGAVFALVKPGLAYLRPPESEWTLSSIRENVSDELSPACSYYEIRIK